MGRLVHVALVVTVVAAVIPMLLVGASAWYGTLFSANVQAFVWGVVGVSYIPYTQIKTKALAGAYCAASFVDLLLFFAWDYGISSQVGRGLQLGLVLLWFVWLFRMQYNRPNDPIRYGYIYKITVRPNSIQDFLLSYWRDPGGGVSAVINGK